MSCGSIPGSIGPRPSSGFEAADGAREAVGVSAGLWQARVSGRTSTATTQSRFILRLYRFPGSLRTRSRPVLFGVAPPLTAEQALPPMLARYRIARG